MSTLASFNGGDAYNAEITKSIVGGRGNVNLMFNFAETAQRDNAQALILLQQKIASGAFHNSDERYDPPKCHPHTRQAVLKKIMDWVRDVQKPSRFMWLYGPAGSGKSAIAQTIAEMCYEAGLLAATFFFSRTITGRNEKTYLITTLVYQIILVIPEIRDRVVKALEHNPMIFSTSLKTQVQALLIRPLNDALLSIKDDKDRQAFRSRPHFIIVDGLDECKNEEAQAYILEILSYAVQEVSVPVSFLVASRPEQQIRDAFNEDDIASLTNTLVLDDTYHPLADIKIFLESKFNDIKRKHPSRARFPRPWPEEPDIRQLVNKSSGQFIYAATVIKYIESRRHLPPDRLKIVLGLSDPGNDTPFAELDALYNHILSSVFDVDKVIKLFMILIFWRSPKRPLMIEEFLFCRPGEIDIILSDLQSLIVLPPPEEERGELRISHASLGDFLRDRSRSGRFFIDGGVANAEILRLLLKHLTEDKDNRKAYREWSGHFDFYYQMATQSPELMEDLYNFDLVFLFDSATRSMTPAPEEVRPMYGRGNKVPLDSRWPNVAQYFFWLQKLRHPDPSKVFHNVYLHTFSTWLYTQLTRFYPLTPSLPGTPLMLAAVTLPNFYSINSSASTFLIQHIIHSIKPWPDLETQRWRDPIHIYYLYSSFLSGVAAEWYYTEIGKFLMDKEKAREYFIDENLYAELGVVVLQFLADSEKCKWSDQAKTALSLLSPILERSAKTPELSKLLLSHSMRCSDPEDQLYAKKHEVADKVDAFLSA